jgi:hypothetical protein
VDSVLLFGCTVLLFGLVALASISMLASIVALALAGGITVLTCFGLEKTGTGLIFLAMVFAPMNSVGPSAAVSFVTFADLFFFLGFSCLLPTMLLRRSPAPPLLYIIGAIILVAVGSVTSIGATHPGISLNLMSRLVVTALGLPLAFMFWRPGWKLTGYLAGGYVLGVIISAGYGVVTGTHSSGLETRYIGLTEQPNELGLTGLLGAALIPYIVKVMPPTHRWFWWGAGAINVGAIWISGSRAALLVLVMMAFIYPIIEKSAKATAWLFAGITIGLALSSKLLADKSGALGRLLGAGSASASDEQRSGLIHEGLALFQAHPLFGSGFETALIYHVIYLEVAVCVGIFGLVGFLFLLGSGVLPLFTAPRPLHRLAYPALAYALVGCLTPLLWDRYIWSAIGLSYLVATTMTPADRAEIESTYAEPTKERVNS